jgi:hypothetical protein
MGPATHHAQPRTNTANKQTTCARKQARKQHNNQPTTHPEHKTQHTKSDSRADNQRNPHAYFTKRRTATEGPQKLLKPPTHDPRTLKTNKQKQAPLARACSNATGRP